MMDDWPSPAKKKRKQPLHLLHPLLEDAERSSVTIPVDESSEGAGLFEGKELWLIQLPRDVSMHNMYFTCLFQS